MWEDTLKLDLEVYLATMEILTITTLEHHNRITLMEQESLLLMVDSEMEVMEIHLILDS